ncbi:MAG: Uma2 family endonuclease [Synechococcaceae cyanobacterium SM1_2_3]|nr:Uma2 family endonuclease [Synechococcaceae cyanobacterium SM1_2_3]
MSELDLIEAVDDIQVDPDPPACPPTQDELPYEDDVPMESERHKLQMDLLLETLQPWLEQRDNGYIGGNMFVYFALEQTRGLHVRGPDVLIVLDVPKGERKSWVVWEQGKAPDVVIELLSDSTRETDKTMKKKIYLEQLRIPEYYWYDPFNPDDWAGFRMNGREYQPLNLDESGRMVSQQMQLALLRWSGIYRGLKAVWLRWVTLQGELLLTGEERAEQERQRADQEQQRAEQAELLLLAAQQRIAELEAQSRAAGNKEGG